MNKHISTSDYNDYNYGSGDEFDEIDYEYLYESEEIFLRDTIDMIKDDILSFVTGNYTLCEYLNNDIIKDYVEYVSTT